MTGETKATGGRAGREAEDDDDDDYYPLTYYEALLKIMSVTIMNWSARGLVRTRYLPDGHNRQIKMYSLRDVLAHDATRTSRRTPSPPDPRDLPEQWAHNPRALELLRRWHQRRTHKRFATTAEWKASIAAGPREGESEDEYEIRCHATMPARQWTRSKRRERELMKRIRKHAEDN